MLPGHPATCQGLTSPSPWESQPSLDGISETPVVDGPSSLLQPPPAFSSLLQPPPAQGGGGGGTPPCNEGASQPRQMLKPEVWKVQSKGI